MSASPLKNRQGWGGIVAGDDAVIVVEAATVAAVVWRVLPWILLWSYRGLVATGYWAPIDWMLHEDECCCWRSKILV